MAAKKTGSPRNIPLLIILLVFLSVILYGAYLETLSPDDGLTDPAPDPAASAERSAPDPAAALRVHFIDVGQGDCSLIMFGESAVLIDAGETERGARVAEYLNAAGVGKLDYVITTHPHADHIGGMPVIIAKFPIDKIISPRVRDELTPTSKSYENFLLAVIDKGLKLTAANAGDRYTLFNGDAADDKVILEIISPFSPQSDGYDDLNDYSVVIRLTYKNTAFLFMGDASRRVEKDIMNAGAEISADVLKAGHHGSGTSSSAEFLAVVSPSVCVIQCGAGNSYNHPNAGTVARLEDAGVRVYRNDLDGTVVVVSDGDAVTVVR
jgi:beta-lactamase superfamily II metal-dependent hydrolase